MKGIHTGVLGSFAIIFFSTLSGMTLLGSFGAEGTPTRHLALGDVDGDGRLDIVVGNNCANNAVFLNRALRVSR